MQINCVISHQSQSYIGLSGAIRQALVEQTNKEAKKQPTVTNFISKGSLAGVHHM
jgi:hypothetical protein